MCGAAEGERSRIASDVLRLLADTDGGPSARTPGGEDQERTVAGILRLSLDRISADHGPLPEALLRVLSWYAPDAIPVELLHAVGGLLEYVDDDESVGATADDIDEALTALAGYALLAHEGDTVSVHPRVADSPIVLWNAAAQFLLDQGSHDRATFFFRRALSDLEESEGPDHPSTLAVRHNLGLAHTAAGEYPLAIRLMKRVARKNDRTNGPDHPDSVIARDNLAGAAASVAGRSGRRGLRGWLWRSPGG